jgi:hypothetical protein
MLDNLSNDLLIKILSNLNLIDRTELRRVNKKFMQCLDTINREIVDLVIFGEFELDFNSVELNNRWYHSNEIINCNNFVYNLDIFVNLNLLNAFCARNIRRIRSEKHLTFSEFHLLSFCRLLAQLELQFLTLGTDVRSQSIIFSSLEIFYVEKVCIAEDFPPERLKDAVFIK